jgi:hypothetical protein
MPGPLCASDTSARLNSSRNAPPIQLPQYPATWPSRAHTRSTETTVAALIDRDPLRFAKKSSSRIKKTLDSFRVFSYIFGVMSFSPRYPVFAGT